MGNALERSLLDPSEAAAAALRAVLIRAAFATEPPSNDIHLRMISWSRSIAPNSVRALASDLKIVDAHQAVHNRPTLPIAPIDLYLLIDQRARAGAANSSIDRLVASMVRIHQVVGMPSPVDDNVRWKQREIRRADTRPVRQAHGMRLKGDVADIHADPAAKVSLLRLLASIPNDVAGLRDRALISTGYDAGLRRSELVRICVDHLEWQPTGEASLFLPKSKTDQEGEGARAWLSRRSVGYLQAWLSAASLTDGYVFQALSYRVGARGHLAEGSVGKILKRRLEQFLLQLADQQMLSPAEARKIVTSTSAHSLRVGCDQDLFAAGVDIGAIMQGLRWSSPKQPLAYARHLAPGTSKLAAMMRKIAT